MITFITGLPGNGKTLFALWYIKNKAEKEQREVYYHNIKDLTLPWTVIDPQKWMDCPKGSIIVLDECQFVFPKLANGAVKPAWYEQLAVHRHSGFDIYLITQHPSLVDNFVRQLGGQHFHSVRKFGMQRSTIYEWSAVNPAPQNPASQKSAIPLKWSYPKEVFGYYKSAEVHTVKRAVPAKIYLAILFVILVLVAGYWALNRYQHRYDKPKDDALRPEAAASAGRVDGRPATPSSSPVQQFDRMADAQHFVDTQTPRIAGLPQTAPKYDALTVPVRVPVPAACIQIGAVSSSKSVNCKCYSQQGTPMDVEFNMCLSFARNGFFQDFDADRDKLANDRTQKEGVAVLQGRSDVSIRTGEPLQPVQRESAVSGPMVVSMAAPSMVSSQRSNLPDKPVQDGQERPSRTVFAPVKG